MRERSGAAESGVGVVGLGLAQQLERATRNVYQAPDLYRAKLSLQTGTFTTPGAAEPAEARLVSPRLTIASGDTSRYLDLGYTEAEYSVPAPGVTGLKLRQFAPSLGFALSGPEDWVTVRLYDVRSPEGYRTQLSPQRTRAVETKFVRALPPVAGGPHELQVSALFGNRMHAVDPDSASIFSLSEMQTGGMSLGAVWKLAPNLRVLFSGGFDRFERGAAAGGGEYSSAYVFTGLKGRW